MWQQILGLRKRKVDINNNFLSDKFKIGFLVLWVGTKCSLKCRDCGNLIPYAAEESYSIDQIIDDMKSILKYCEIEKLQIQGGEPFTHPHIEKLLNEIDNFEIPNVGITTNGTVELSKSTLIALNRIKTQNFNVAISEYSCSKEKQIKFYNTLISNNVNCSNYNFHQNDGSWVDQGGVATERNLDDIQVQSLYTGCDFKVCLSLVNGELYRCGRGKVSKEVFNLQYSDKDYLDIRHVKNANVGFEEISEFVGNVEFKEYCRYCLGTVKKIKAAIQIKPKQF